MLTDNYIAKASRAAQYAEIAQELAEKDKTNEAIRWLASSINELSLYLKRVIGEK